MVVGTLCVVGVLAGQCDFNKNFNDVFIHRFGHIDLLESKSV